jgi:ribosomal protein L20
VSSEDTVSEQVVQARQTRRRRAAAGFWGETVARRHERVAQVVAAAGSNSKRDRRTDKRVALSDWHTRADSLRPQHRRATCKAPGRFSLRAIPLARVWENSPG